MLQEYLAGLRGNTLYRSRPMTEHGRASQTVSHLMNADMDRPAPICDMVLLPGRPTRCDRRDLAPNRSGCVAGPSTFTQSGATRGRPAGMQLRRAV